MRHPILPLSAFPRLSGSPGSSQYLETSLTRRPCRPAPCTPQALEGQSFFQSAVPQLPLARAPPQNPQLFQGRPDDVPALLMAETHPRSGSTHSDVAGLLHARDSLLHKAGMELHESRPRDGMPPARQPGRVAGRHQTDASQFPYAVVTSSLPLLLRHSFSLFDHFIWHTNYLSMRRDSIPGCDTFVCPHPSAHVGE